MIGFGERLKELRKKLNITQADLAEKLNVHSQTISRWERDISEPDMSMYETISKTLSVPLEKLWGVTVPEKSVSGQFDLAQLGKAIYTERKRLKESQDELAGVAGVSSDIVSKWERGLICPDIDTLLSLANHFNISPSELYYFRLESEVVETTGSSLQPKLKKPNKKVILIAVLSSILLIALVAVILLICLKPFASSNNGTVCEHFYRQEEASATCTAQGYVTNVCIKCGDAYVSDYTDKLPHNAGDWITDSEATCTRVGSKHKECSVCHNITESLTIEKIEHNYETTTVPSTCSVKGYTLYTCSTCGNNYKANYSELLLHTQSEWITDKEPTCSQTGSKHKECLVCETQTEMASIEKLPHQYGQKTTASTCTTQGYTTYTCTECGSSYKSDFAPVLAHTSGEWETDKEPTCSQTGGKHKECLSCGAQIETASIEKLPHQYGQKTTASTCTTQGYTTYTCAICGDSYKSDFAPVLAHTSGEWKTDKKPTCVAVGSKHKECLVCGTRTETAEIEKLSHSYRQETAVSTCTTQGYTTYTCINCGDNYRSNYTAMLEHTAGDWITDRAATCGAAGSRHKECAVCKTTIETAVIDKLAHSYIDTIIPPEGDNQGYFLYTCELCGDSYKDNYFLPDSSGLQFNFDYGTKTCTVAGIGEITDTKIEIPATVNGCKVTAIGGHAFGNCVTVQEVIIPETVTEIDSYAFYKCVMLQEIIIPDSVKNIGYEAFCGCRGLINAVLPDKLTRIKYSTFSDCVNLKTVNIPSTVTVIEDLAFNNCHKLNKIELPEGLLSIGGYAFNACAKLEEINIPQTVFRVGDNAFTGCSSLVSVEFGQTEGWVADEIVIDSELLADSETAAKYLSMQYNTYIWVRN